MWSPLRFSTVFLTTVFAWLAISVSAQTTLTWDKDPATAGIQDGAGTWNNQSNTNWMTGGTNVKWNNADLNDIAVFGAGGAAGAITVSGTINAGGLTFNAISNSASAAYTFTGGSLVLTSGAVIDVMDNASSVGGRITFVTPLTGSNLTIRNSDAGNVGFALLNLSGANTLTGNLTVQGNATGGLFVSATVAGALTGLTSATVLNNTTLSLAAPAGTNYNQNFIISGNGSGGRGAVRVDNGSTATPMILSGSITLAATGAAIYSNSGIVTNITGAVGDGGSGFAFNTGTTNAATGTVILSGSNTFTGGLRIDAGEVRLNNAGALNSTTPNLVTFTNTNPSTLKTLTLNGVSVTAAGLASTSGGSGAITTQNANATAATLTIANSSAATYTGTLQDGTGGGKLSLVEAGSATQTLSGAVSLTGSITVSSGTLAVSGPISATSGIAVNGGVLTLSGNNTFTTGINLATGGTLNINSATALGTGPFSVAGTINNTSGSSVAVTTANAMTWSNFTFTGSNALNLGTDTVSLGTGSGTVTVTANASTLTVGGVISDGASNNALTKAGNGIVVLSGANAYSGLTTVTTGILNIQSNTALGTAAAGTMINDGAKLQLQGGITVTGETLTTGFIESVSGSNAWTGNITGPAGTQFTLQSDTGAALLISGNVNANGHTTFLSGGGSGEISGVISNVFNPGGLNLNGTGTWVLSGANTYAAPTNVTSGNLQVGKAGVGQTGTLATTVSSGATLSGSGSVLGAANVAGTLSPGDNGGASAGQLSLKGGLTFNPSAATTSASLTLVSALSADNIHVTGPLTLSSNGNIVVTFDPSYTLNGGDSWDLLDWTGLLTLNGFSSGTNFRTGANTGNEGNLDLPDLTALPGYNGQMWMISTLADGTTGGSLVVTITPEPCRAVLLLLGVLGLGLMRRRNRAGRAPFLSGG